MLKLKECSTVHALKMAPGGNRTSKLKSPKIILTSITFQLDLNEKMIGFSKKRCFQKTYSYFKLYEHIPTISPFCMQRKKRIVHI